MREKINIAISLLKEAILKGLIQFIFNRYKAKTING
jgi:hypothetical protein